ncbi:hypothetical protein GCM10010413_17410 [Promicromonospora sukumoe]|uniref:DUF916 domain-containing protein n=1 Tax=Promicromonospora sukumoe TaxID=88382 RepID=A0A7W3PEZ1_9MICO|nr:DUF916 domain-containing protein [Promicromonospora sukumoe]MBA8809039.1 hypothetical protein [Promicromonospora sukumoe]
MSVSVVRTTTRRAARCSAVLAALVVTLGTAVAGPSAAAAQAAAPMVVPAAVPAAPPAAVPAAVSAAAPTDDVTWGVRTATNEQGTERENFRYTVDPGAKVSDELIVTNHGEGTLMLDVYAADGYTTTTGQLDVLTRDDGNAAADEAGSDDASSDGAASDEAASDETGSVNVGAWLDPAVGQVRLAPGKSADIPFTLQVPDDATPGDYAGAILTSRTVTADEAGLDYETRSGIRVYLRVAGDLEPSLTVTDADVEYHQTLNPFGAGDATVTYMVRNDGNVRLAADQEVSVAGPFGWLAAQGTADGLPELLPGESWPVSVPVEGVVPLFWLGADIRLVAQLPDVAGATPGVAPVEAHTSGWAVPWLLIAVAVLLVGGVFLIVHRRRTRGQREDARVQAAVAKALAEREAAGTGAGATPDGAGAAAELAQAEPSRAESSEAELNEAESGKAGLAEAEPNQAEPTQAGPTPSGAVAP